MANGSRRRVIAAAAIATILVVVGASACALQVTTPQWTGFPPNTPATVHTSTEQPEQSMTFPTITTPAPPPPPTAAPTDTQTQSDVSVQVEQVGSAVASEMVIVMGTGVIEPGVTVTFDTDISRIVNAYPNPWVRLTSSSTVVCIGAHVRTTINWWKQDGELMQSTQTQPMAGGSAQVNVSALGQATAALVESLVAAATVALCQ